MTLKHRLLLCLLLTFGFANDVHAKHIAGGDFTYRRLSGNNFEITLKIFRDCSDFVPFDNSILIGVFNKGTNSLINSYTVALADSGTLTLTGTSCLTPPTGVCMDKCTYIDTITLPNNPSGYYISWERCCRNNAIVNLTRPGDTGIAYYMEIPDPAIIDNSPNFNNDPFPFMCLGQDFDFDYSAYDVDGDLLTYSLETPLAGELGYPLNSTISPVWSNPTPGPYQAAQWLPGYSVTNITGSFPALSLNGSTGLMKVKANKVGFYAMAVVVKEFRNGVQIGQIRREIEFTVINCAANTAPQISYQNSTTPQSGLTFTIYEKDTLCFTVRVTDSDSIKLSYSGDIFAGGSITPPYAVTSSATGNGVATSAFCWYTSCDQGRTQPYNVTFKATDNGCPQPFSSIDSLKIYVLPVPQITAPLIICMNTATEGIIKLTFTDTFAMPRFIDRYVVFRSTNGGPFIHIGSVNNPANHFYNDSTASNLDLNNYCYYIAAVNTCNETGTNSDTICSDNQKNIDTPFILSSQVQNNNSISLTFNNSPDNLYTLFKIEKRENTFSALYADYFQQQGFAIPQWTDSLQNVTEKSYCYRITKKNQCEIESPVSNESCSILLTGQSLPLQHILNWTPYTEWPGGVSYYAIFRRPLNSSTFTEIAQLASNILTFTDTQIPQENGDFIYYIKAVHDTLNVFSTSNEVTLIQEPSVFTPNSFTPNGDGLNETWSPVSSFIKNYNLRIFNRWGNLIFESNESNRQWDGSYQGQPASLGIYFYVITYIGYPDNTKFYKRGSVTLLR